MVINWWLVILAIILINEILAVITVFRQPRDIAATWAWLLVLILLPVVGFIIYAFFGRKLPRNKLFMLKGLTKKQVASLIAEQQEILEKSPKTDNPSQKLVYKNYTMAQMFMNNAHAPLFGQNDVKTFTSGEEFMGSLVDDINTAKSSINIEFYTFYADKIGHKVLDALVAKAKEGVDVRIIYDAWGSMGTNKKFFKPLTDAGGHAFPFLNNKLNVWDCRVNFRDHHKIVAIDGHYGYIGGFNIGDQYMGWDPKFGNWRDTTIRIHGKGVYGLQSQFLLDWNATDKDLQVDPNAPEEIKKYYPKIDTQGDAIMQIVASGPDTAKEQIEMGYIKMIASAKKKIQITTPYLIPDPPVFDALKIAIQSGVDVQIIVPDMPDHPFVYRATQYYSRALVKLGAKIYFYNNGFMHAKTVLVDDEICSVGSANFDYRSFKLNFECNSFIYDETCAKVLDKIFLEDIKHSTLQTNEMFDHESAWLNFKQHFSRLLSPLL